MRRAVRPLILALAVLNGALIAIALVLKSRLRPAGDEDSDEVALVSIMDEVKFASRARAFHGGTVFTMMGATEIDLRGAGLAPGGARLRVQTYMGGAEVIVPPGWRVATRTRAFMGGTSGGRPADGAAADLTIEGVIVMGGLDIRERAPGG